MISRAPSRTPENDAPGADAVAAAPPTALEPVTLHYTLTEEDVAAYYRHLREAAGARRNGVTVLAFTAMGIMLILGGLEIADAPYAGSMARGLLWIAAGPLLVGLLWWSRRATPRILVRRLIRRGRHVDLFDPITATLDADGLHVTTTHTQTLWRWPAIRRIEPGPGATYLYLSDIQAIIVPDHAFEDDRAREGAVAAMEGWHRSATSRAAA